MKIWNRIFGHTEQKKSAAAFGIPTVKFDKSLVTKAVEADLKQTIVNIRDIPPKYHMAIYRIALASVLNGRNLAMLSKGITALNIDGIDPWRIAQITRFVHSRTAALMQRDRQIKLGIARAEWVYANAPCEGPSPHQDEEHRNANGREFEISEGLFVDGIWTWPGREEGCKCTSRAIIKGFS